MVFRKAKETELERIFALYQSAKGEPLSVWNEEYPTKTDVERDFQTGNLFVLAEDNDIIGALSVVCEKELDELPHWKEKKNAEELARVVVAKEYRNNGFSTLMVQKIEALLRKKGCRALHLLAAKKNFAALKSYDKAGFVKMGETNMYGNDYFLLEKILAAPKE